jgi:hypothetical protein
MTSLVIAPPPLPPVPDRARSLMIYCSHVRSDIWGKYFAPKKDGMGYFSSNYRMPRYHRLRWVGLILEPGSERYVLIEVTPHLSLGCEHTATLSDAKCLL